MSYILTAVQKMFASVAARRMESGFGASLLLEGPPGGGKTSFAKYLSEDLNADLLFYSSNEYRNTDLLYRIDVKGVIKREGAWVKGPAWIAFERSLQGKFSILLIDELDKASPEFDAFLLRLLEEWTFESPEGDVIKGDPSKILVVLTTNGRRRLRGEVLRRCQRINFPFPDENRLKDIMFSILKWEKNNNSKLIDLTARIGYAIFNADAEQAPSPKELAMLCLDAVSLAQCEKDICSDSDQHAVWQELAMSYLTKGESAEFVKKALEKAGLRKFNWVRALRAEATNVAKQEVN